MRYLVLSFLAFLPFPGSALAVQANGCPDYLPATVSVRQLVVTPGYNDTMSLTDLSRMATEGSQTIAGNPKDTPVGLTAASLKFDSRYEIRTISSTTDNTVCAQVWSFDLGFGFDDTVIYLANELSRGTCSYQTVLEHELRHVRTDRSIVDATIPNLPAMLKEALAEIGVIKASSQKVAEEQIREIINQYISGFGANLSEVREAHQHEIDTPEEYARLSASCDGELGRLISSLKERS